MNKIPAELPAKAAAKKKSRLAKIVSFSPIWIFPAAAIVIGLSLLWKEFKTAGIPVTVRFQSAAGIEANKTLVKFRGVKVGKVVNISMNEDYSLDVELEMDHRAAPILVADTEFWLVKPNISVNGISGLDTLLSGSYITLRPGSQKQVARSFTALSVAPTVSDASDGLAIQFDASDLGSLKVDSPILYKKIPVGRISGYQLIDDNNRVLIQAFINEEYSHLVKSESVFWNTSAMELKAGLTGIALKTDSIMTLLTGGVSFSTPPGAASDRVVTNHRFKLFDDYRKARSGIEFELQVAHIPASKLDDLPIMYQNEEIGYVAYHESITGPSAAANETLKAYLHPNYDFILKSQTKFWLESPRISFKSLLDFDYLTKGSYITFTYDEATATPQRQFTLLQHRPSEQYELKQQTLKLVASVEVALKLGTKILDRDRVIGEVTRLELNQDGSSYQVEAAIDQEFLPRIGPKSFLFPRQPVKIKGGLRDFSVAIAPLDQMADYFLEFSQLRPVPPANKPQLPSSPIRIHASEDEGRFSKALSLSVSNAEGLLPGITKVNWKGIPIGYIAAIAPQWQTESITMEARVLPEIFARLNENSLFYKAEAKFSLAGIKDAEKLVAGTAIRLTLGSGTAGPQPHYQLSTTEQQTRSVEVLWQTSKPPQIGNPVEYNGMPIGTVTSLTLAKDLQSVRVTLSIAAQYPAFFKEDTIFWLKMPKIGLSGIENGAALLTGPSVGVLPGQSSEQRTAFVGLTNYPRSAKRQDGSLVVLESDQSYSVSPGSPLHYKGIPIGEVVAIDLKDDSSSILTTVLVHSKYSRFLSTKSKFWVSSGVDINFGLFSGFNLDTDSIESMIRGGIALATPSFSTEPPPNSTLVYRLAAKPEDEWLSWNPTELTSDQSIAH